MKSSGKIIYTQFHHFVTVCEGELWNGKWCRESCLFTRQSRSMQHDSRSICDCRAIKLRSRAKIEALKHRPELELTASAKPVNLTFTHLLESPVQKLQHETHLWARTVKLSLKIALYATTPPKFWAHDVNDLTDNDCGITLRTPFNLERELPIQKRHHETTQIVAGLFLLLLGAVFFTNLAYFRRHHHPLPPP